MKSVKGRDVRVIDAEAVTAWAAGYPEVVLDLGAGDGRFVRHQARRNPTRAAIGIDTCQANLRDTSRTAPGNVLFIVADALMLPIEVQQLATHVTINYPWGSLLRGLLDGHDRLLDGMGMGNRDDVSLEVRLNAGALSEAGWELEAGSQRVAKALESSGFAIGQLSMMGRDDLRGFPTTWAKRLAFGRDPRAIHIAGVRKPEPQG